MIAASPNCRSRSSSSVRFCSYLANAAARFVAITVLPVPPFGEKTVTMRPSCLRRAAGHVDRRFALAALRIAKTTFSVSCGRSRTSVTSASSASSSSAEDSPEAITKIGARVCSRIAAISPAGSELDARRVEDAVEMPAGERGGGLGDVLRGTDELELVMGGEGVAQ